MEGGRRAPYQVRHSSRLAVLDAHPSSLPFSFSRRKPRPWRWPLHSQLPSIITEAGACLPQRKQERRGRRARRWLVGVHIPGAEQSRSLSSSRRFAGLCPGNGRSVVREGGRTATAAGRQGSCSPLLEEARRISMLGGSGGAISRGRGAYLFPNSLEGCEGSIGRVCLALAIFPHRPSPCPGPTVWVESMTTVSIMMWALVINV